MRTTRVNMAVVDVYTMRKTDTMVDAGPDVNVYFTVLPGKEYGVLRLKGPKIDRGYDVAGFVLEHVDTEEVTIG